MSSPRFFAASPELLPFLPPRSVGRTMFVAAAFRSLETVAVRPQRQAAATDALALRDALLVWHRASARDLPWRRRRNPWRVWVSEIMLQQTRVDAVVEPYARFLRKFPTLSSMASAEEDAVLAEWSGLGYYRRARLLHAGARYVAERHSGRVPRSRAALEKVPGIGSYTAAAILSLAFGQREAALDANVLRVVARVLGVGDGHSTAGRHSIAAFAARLVDCEEPGRVNEALMDLGAAVCTARVARCALCPLAPRCRARSSGDALAFGAARAKPAPRDVRLACVVVADGDRVLVVRRCDEDRLLGGMWELPTVEITVETTGDRAPATALARQIRLRAGIRVVVGPELFDVRHDIVGRRIRATVYEARVRGQVPRVFPDDARMIALESGETRRDIALPALPVKILKKLRHVRGVADASVSAGFSKPGRARPDRAPMRSSAARGAA